MGDIKASSVDFAETDSQEFVKAQDALQGLILGNTAAMKVVNEDGSTDLVLASIVDDPDGDGFTVYPVALLLGRESGAGSAYGYAIQGVLNEHADAEGPTEDPEDVFVESEPS